ncbi:MAG TPA: hypothetical protein VK714_08990 [Myxococcota bacterium]|nr:hypothetical protein [Myxococcota bacterium]
MQPTRAESVAPDSTSGLPTLRLIERALDSNQRYRRVTWIDPETSFRFGLFTIEASQRFFAAAEEVRMVQAIPTPKRIIFEKVAPSETTTMEVTNKSATREPTSPPWL